MIDKVITNLFGEQTNINTDNTNAIIAAVIFVGKFFILFYYFQQI